MADQQILDFYLQPGTMTSIAEHDEVLGSLPGDVPSLARFVQGLLLHEHLAPVYGQHLSDERRSDTHLRHSSRMLERALAVSPEPLGSLTRV